MSAVAAARDTRLDIRGLRHAYGERVVLEDLSFAVRRGEIFGLLGPNGSGKSTTFHVLTGLVVPRSVEVRLDGRVVEPGGRELRTRMGVVFQSASADARLTARENLTMAAALHGIAGREARERIEELLAFAELADRADEPVKKFSGGMRRRLELVRALLASPELLVMDEPTSGLDESSFQRFWDRVAQLREREGLTVLLTTHRPEEAERCDRVAVIDGGRVVAEGTPDTLRAQVAGDVLTLAGEDPEGLARAVHEKLGVEVRVVDGRVQIERERGHELVPRIVEALPAGRLASLSMRRPTLADVFLKITGRSFER